MYARHQSNGVCVWVLCVSACVCVCVRTRMRKCACMYSLRARMFVHMLTNVSVGIIVKDRAVASEQEEDITGNVSVEQNEAKQDGGSSEDHSGPQHSTVSMKNLDELLKFINGTDSEGSKADSQQSSKAAKRARQKQRRVSGFSTLIWKKFE